MERIAIDVRVRRAKNPHEHTRDYEEREPIVGRYYLKYTRAASIKRMHTRLLNRMKREYPDWRVIDINNVEV